MRTKFSFFLFVLVLLSVQCEFPKESNDWTTWINENAQSIKLSNSDNYEDLEFLHDILKDKKVVFLGESAHGVSEYNTLKLRIIRYLHEEMNFNVLAFECNAGDAFAVNLEYPFGDAKTALYNSISTFWHVEENILLFEYINQKSLTDNKLSIAVIDITLSNGSYAFSRFLESLIEPIDPAYAEEVRKGDSLFLALGLRKWTLGLEKSEINTYDSIKNLQLANYQNLIDFLIENKKAIQAPNKHLEAAIFYTNSRIHFIHQVNRDSAYMANFLEVSPKRKKISIGFTNNFAKDFNLKI
ncbi:hypothetical protein [Marivirga sp.]|uniref:hypothetical protein n=1 Tax=Marivirga sp. TaxID=2018662 RepID=UPI003DA74E5B